MVMQRGFHMLVFAVFTAAAAVVWLILLKSFEGALVMHVEGEKKVE